MNKQSDEPDILSETENFGIWRNEEEGEVIYHLEMADSITLHLTAEEWEEFLVLMKSLEIKN